jgi:ubiquitin carboxyl-terminal hydrolase 16/45
MKPGQNQVLYALYGVVEHSGTLHGGHYVAYVKVSFVISAVCNIVMFSGDGLMLLCVAGACSCSGQRSTMVIPPIRSSGAL